MNIATLQCNVIPTIGSFLNTTVPQEILNSISSTMTPVTSLPSNIAQFIEKGKQKFINEIINPLKQTLGLVKNKINVHLDDSNTIRVLSSLEDLLNPPPAMILPIVTFKPIRKLLEDGRVDGYGINAQHLPDEDVYDRLINNGKVDDVLDNLFPRKLENGETEYYIMNKNMFTSEDPDLTFEELDAIEETREFLLEVLRTTQVDPTNPSKLR